METSLYNHDYLGSVEKPLIPNKVFKDACQAIKMGHSEVYEQTLDRYTLEETQLRILKEYFNHVTQQK